MKRPSFKQINSIATVLTLAGILCGYVRAATPTDARSGAEALFAIPTFHCLGLYWSPPGGAADKQVLMRYRRQGAAEWKEALPMRYNPIPKTDEDLADYRGSIVYLTPATTYEVQLTLEGTPTTKHLTATTWSEDFPVGATVRAGDRDTPLVITESGTPNAWRVYDGRGATIDVRHQHDACITINASNVIILQVRTPQNWSASDNKQNADTDFDYDLYNGRIPQSQEAHGVRGEPAYAPGAGFDPATKTGRFQLASDSPGAGAGQLVPNFSGGYTGKAPDIGAHQRGTPPIQYGVRASQP